MRRTFATWDQSVWKTIGKRLSVHIGLVLVWFVMGLLLRLFHLTLKPLWADEFSTIVFSLGHSYQSIPLSEWLSTRELLSPALVNPQTGIGSVIEHLLTESNHPPLYFVLTHGWLSLFPNSDGLVSVWGVRSLSAVFGAAAIPAIFGLGWLAFQSKWVGHLAAVMMAVSPFAIYLAQEARHYTLAIIWIVASLCALVIAVRSIQHQTSLPIGVALGWVGVNALGIATHYFVVLTLIAECWVLVGVAWHVRFHRRMRVYGGRIGAVIIGTIASGLVWLPFLTNAQNNDELTRWIYQDGWAGLGLLSPLLQLVTSWVSMIYLLPVQNVPSWVSRLSGIVLIGLTIGLTGWVYRGLRAHWQHRDARIAIQTLGGFCLGAIATFLAITYGLGIDLTQVFRYNFVYFPAVLVIVAAGLAGSRSLVQNALTPTQGSEQSPSFSRARPMNHLCQPIMIGLVIIVGMIGALSVVNDLGFRKVHRPDRVAWAIAANSEAPAVVAISHQSHGHTGRLMGVAWELRSLPQVSNPQFFLDHQECRIDGEQNCNTPSPTLQKSLTTLPRPFDLWLLNYEGDADLREQGCVYDKTRRVDGYKYQFYRCRD